MRETPLDKSSWSIGLADRGAVGLGWDCGCNRWAPPVACEVETRNGPKICILKMLPGDVDGTNGPDNNPLERLSEMLVNAGRDNGPNHIHAVILLTNGPIHLRSSPSAAILVPGCNP
jgi:hypothetical protein